MTMKRRFLGLALAAAVTIPATTAYAAGNTGTVTGNDTQTLEQNVTVSGTVNNKKGAAPEGKLTVELPTTMAFTVDEKSNFIGANYTVKNQSQVGIRVSVSDFRTANGNITVADATNFEAENVDRSNVTLSLDGRVDGAETFVDLGAFKTGTDDIDVLDVRAQDSAVLTLNGEAGKKEITDDTNGVDAKGAKGEFVLVFKINKNEKLK